MKPGGQMQSPVSSWQTPLFRHIGQFCLQSGPHFPAAHSCKGKTKEKLEQIRSQVQMYDTKYENT